MASRNCACRTARYHRWSQDAKRAHFGLAGTATVDLRVEWPSGNVQTFNNVAANKLYRITESSGIAAVNLGAAPAYQCGPPTINAASTGVFVWRDCPTGEWSMKTAAGGGTSNILYSGKIVAAVPYTSVKPVGLTATDSLDYTSDPKQISFAFNTKGQSSDGVNFRAPDGTEICLGLSSPAGVQVLYGPFRSPLAQPFGLEGQRVCTP